MANGSRARTNVPRLKAAPKTPKPQAAENVFETPAADNKTRRPGVRTTVRRSNSSPIDAPKAPKTECKTRTRANLASRFNAVEPLVEDEFLLEEDDDTNLRRSKRHGGHKRHGSV